MKACSDIPDWELNFEVLCFTRSMYEILYSVVLITTCGLVLYKMDFFRKRTEYLSQYITVVFLMTALSNLVCSLLIVMKYRADTSWVLFFVESTVGSKWIARWTFAAQYIQVCVILPQLFPQSMLPFTLQDFVDDLIQQKRQAAAPDRMHSKLTAYFQTSETDLPQIIKTLDQSVVAQNE